MDRLAVDLMPTGGAYYSSIQSPATAPLLASLFVPTVARPLSEAEIFVLPQFRIAQNRQGRIENQTAQVDHVIRFAQITVAAPGGEDYIRAGKQRVPWADFKTAMVDDDLHPLRRLLDVQKRLGLSAGIGLLPAPRGAVLQASLFAAESDPAFFREGRGGPLTSESVRLILQRGDWRATISSMWLRNSAERPTNAGTAATVSWHVGVLRLWADFVSNGGGEPFKLPAGARRFVNAAASVTARNIRYAFEHTVIGSSATHEAVGVSFPLWGGYYGPQVRYVRNQRAPDEWIGSLEYKFSLSVAKRAVQ